MNTHTRRQFLGFVASLLTLIDAVRRFFKPPEVVRREPTIKGVGLLWRDRPYHGPNPDDLLRDILEHDGLDLCEPFLPGMDRRLLPTEQEVRALADRLGVKLKDRTLS